MVVQQSGGSLQTTVPVRCIPDRTEAFLGVCMQCKGSHDEHAPNHDLQKKYLDQDSIANAKLSALVGGRNLTSAEVDDREQVLRCECDDSAEGID